MKLLGFTKGETEYNRNKIKNIILNYTRKSGGIIHGGRALNERLPELVRKKTYDYDIFMNKPRKHAKELQEQLNKTLGRNICKVKKSMHKGTYRITCFKNKPIVDITQPPKDIEYETSIDKIKFAKIEYLKKKAMSTLAKLKYEFRHKKDLKTLKLIKKYEEALGWDKW